jgi:hypothetical protein
MRLVPCSVVPTTAILRAFYLFYTSFGVVRSGSGGREIHPGA